MKYQEKAFDPIEMQLPDMLTNPPKMPFVALKAMARMNLGKLRDGMGGNAKDIVRRPVATVAREIPGYKGAVPVRVYTPESVPPAPRPLLLFFHGGGWFGGSMQTVEPFCRAVADRADAVVVNVGYHLCPEFPYPHGLEDCYRALEWVCAEPSLGIDASRVVVAGDSAGGNLAAALCLMSRDRGGPAIAGQLLLYPAVTLRDFASPAGGDGGAFGRLLVEWYLGDARRSAEPYASPLLADSLAGLPRALVAVGELDGLREQCLAYAQKLSDADVDVTCLLYKGTQHAFIDNTGTQPAAEDMIDEAVRFVLG